jgi:hypothetical protein
LWWTKWHWDRFFPEYFGFPLSVSFHRCSITSKRTKNNHHLVIFITGLHKKPQGCDASAASAAGPFTTNPRISITYWKPFNTRIRAWEAENSRRMLLHKEVHLGLQRAANFVGVLTQ